MIGSIIGDIVGSVYEFTPNNSKTKEFEFFDPDGSYTDDSVLTFATADWLLHGGEVAHYYSRYGEKYPWPMGGYGGGFKLWLIRTIRQQDFRPYNSSGNGSAMRVGPVGWAFNTMEEVLSMAKESAECTHNHPEGIKGAQATAAAVFLARSGVSKEGILDYIERTYGYDLHKTWDYWHPVYGWEDSCQGTVPQALIAFLDSSCFEDAIRKAVSLGGDSDTLACITGGIAEAYYKEIPKFMADRVAQPFPRIFNKILDAVREETVYGKTCKIVE